MAPINYHKNGQLDAIMSTDNGVTAIDLDGQQVNAIANGPLEIRIAGGDATITQNGILFPEQRYEIQRGAQGELIAIAFPAAPGVNPSALTLKLDGGDTHTIAIASPTMPEAWSFHADGTYTIARDNRVTVVNANGGFTRTGSHEEIRNKVLYTIAEDTRGTNYGGPGLSLTITELTSGKTKPERTAIISERLPSGDVANIEVFYGTSRILIADANHDGIPDNIAFSCDTNLKAIARLINLDKPDIIALDSQKSGAQANINLTSEQVLALENARLSDINKVFENAGIAGFTLDPSNTCAPPIAIRLPAGFAVRE